jgi:hypothetical protein
MATAIHHTEAEADDQGAAMLTVAGVGVDVGVGVAEAEAARVEEAEAAVAVLGEAWAQTARFKKWSCQTILWRGGRCNGVCAGCAPSLTAW